MIQTHTKKNSSASNSAPRNYTRRKKKTTLDSKIYQVLLLIKYSNANLVDMRNETKVCNAIR